MSNKNPCRGCHNEAADKNNAECMACDKRVAYWQGLGGLSDMGPMVRVTAPSAALKERPAVFRGELKTTEGHQMEDQAEYKSAKVCRGEVCRALCEADLKPFLQKEGGIERPLSEFGPNEKSKDGLMYRCRMCTAYAWKKSTAQKNGETAPDPLAYAKMYKSYRSISGTERGSLSARPVPADSFVEGTLEQTAPPVLAVTINISIDPASIDWLRDLLRTVSRGGL